MPTSHGKRLLQEGGGKPPGARTVIARFLAILVIFALGILARRRFHLDPGPLSQVTSDLFMPALVFLSLAETPLEGAAILHPAAACFWVILGSIALVGAAGRGARRPWFRLVLPIAFMNSGFFGIPFAEAMGGADWVAKVIIYDQAMNLVLFTAGTWAIGAHAGLASGLRAAFLNPNVAAILLAIAWKLTGEPLPEELKSLLELPAKATIPVALFCMGAALPRIGAHTNWAPLLGAVAARFALGIALASGYIAVFRPDPVTARVILMVSTMPSAVFSYILNARYGGEAGHAAETVFVSTLCLPVVFPAVNFVLAPLILG